MKTLNINQNETSSLFKEEKKISEKGSQKNENSKQDCEISKSSENCQPHFTDQRKVQTADRNTEQKEELKNIND